MTDIITKVDRSQPKIVDPDVMVHQKNNKLFLIHLSKNTHEEYIFKSVHSASKEFNRLTSKER